MNVCAMKPVALAVASGWCLAAAASAQETPTAEAVSPKFLDERRLPPVSPVTLVERGKRDAAAATLRGAPRTIEDDQRLIADTDAATMRALEERERAAEVRRRAEELSQRFTGEKHEDTQVTSGEIVTSSTEGAPAVAADTEDHGAGAAIGSANVVAPSRPPVPKANAATHATKKARAPVQPKARRVAKVQHGASVVHQQPKEAPKQEGLLAKVKAGFSSLKTALFPSLQQPAPGPAR